MKIRRQCQANERPQTRSLYWCLSVFCVLFLLVELSFGATQSSRACQPVLSLHNPNDMHAEEVHLVARAQLQTLTVEHQSPWREGIFNFIIYRSLHLPQMGSDNKLSLVVFESQKEADLLAKFLVEKDVFHETRVFQLTANEGVHRLPRFEEFESLLDTHHTKRVPFVIVISTHQLKDYLVQQARLMKEPIAFIMNLLMERVHSLVTVEQRKIDENQDRKSEQLGMMIRRYLPQTSALAHIIVESTPESASESRGASSESLENKTSVPVPQKLSSETSQTSLEKPQVPKLNSTPNGIYSVGSQQPYQINQQAGFLSFGPEQRIPKIPKHEVETNKNVSPLPTEKKQVRQSLMGSSQRGG